jgi:hypothetical protein
VTPRKPSRIPDWLFNALDPERAGRFLARRAVRLALAWAAALATGAGMLIWAWGVYRDDKRPDGNVGHVLIDFSGQWLMGRMLVRGHGPELYRTRSQDEVLAEAYGADDGGKVAGWLTSARGDADDAFGRLLARLREWAGVDCDGVAGPLYPPINALLYYPLGLLTPQAAYRAAQIVNILLTFIIGLLVERLTRGRVWAPVGVLAVMFFPGYNGALCLSQNALLSLAVLMLGWLLIARGRPWLGGCVWGLLAFKPVWAAAFFLVPLLTGRWRVMAAMALTGLALAALTVPLVGWQPWLDWLAVGRAATARYATSESWVFLSRDVQTLPLRWLVRFADLRAVEDGLPAAVGLGQALWGTAVAATVGVALWRRRRPAGVDGPPAAFLLLGAWLSCLHFMYYDVLLAGLPVCLLFTEPGRYLTPAPVGRPGPRGGWVWNPFPPTLLALLIVLPHAADGIDYYFLGRANHYPPLDTFCLIALWLWCGWQWLWAPGAAGGPAPGLTPAIQEG